MIASKVKSFIEHRRKFVIKMINNLNNKIYEYKTLHWYEIPLSYFSLKLEAEFKNIFFDKIYEKRKNDLNFSLYINKSSKKYGKTWSLKSQRSLIWEYKSHTKFVPAWYIFECAIYLKIDLDLIESKIISYLSFRGKIEVYKPKFPISVSPLMTSIVSHILGDGCYANNKFSYYQKKSEHLKRFKDIIEEIFGTYNVIYKKNYYTPRIFSDIISKEFDIYEYGTFKSQIPDKVFNLSKPHKVAFFSAYLLDEGSVNGNVCFYSSNMNLINGLIKLGNSLDYQFLRLYSKKPSGNSKICYRLTMNKPSIKKIYDDLTQLYEIYPILHINEKYSKIKNLIDSYKNNGKQRIRFETKNIIMDSLKESPKTAIQLVKITQNSLWTVYHHLQKLEKTKIIKKTKRKQDYLYQLI